MAKKTPTETLKSLATELQEMSKTLPEVPHLYYLFNNALCSVMIAHDYLNSYLKLFESYNSGKSAVNSPDSSKS